MNNIKRMWINQPSKLQLKIRSNNPIFNSWLKETKEGNEAQQNIRTSEDFKHLQNAFLAGQQYQQRKEKDLCVYGKDTP